MASAFSRSSGRAPQAPECILAELEAVCDQGKRFYCHGPETAVVMIHIQQHGRQVPLRTRESEQCRIDRKSPYCHVALYIECISKEGIASGMNTAAQRMENALKS